MENDGKKEHNSFYFLHIIIWSWSRKISHILEKIYVDIYWDETDEFDRLVMSKDERHKFKFSNPLPVKIKFT